jgi:hypothetical protein
MTRIVVERRVDNDGLLQLTIPLGSEEAGRDVRVTIESVGSEKQMTQEEWRAGILATAGGWQGEAVQALSRVEKFQIAQMLLDDLAKEELLTEFTEGHVFPVYTPEYSPDAAAQLAQALTEEGTES